MAHRGHRDCRAELIGGANMRVALSKQWARLLGAGEGAEQGAEQGARVVAWHVRAADSDWVSRVWTWVQTQAGLPAPAIAVDGRGGWLLCFALPSSRPVNEAQAVLRQLIRDGLDQGGATVSVADAAAWRLTCWPADLPADASDDAVPVPRQVAPDRWSAFVAPDLVPVFAESPWLDCAPSEEGQAALLSKLVPIPAEQWARLLAVSSRDVADSLADRVSHGDRVGQPASHPGAPLNPLCAPQPASNGAALGDAPRAFLLAVMNAASVDLALRIEAARVLLAHG
jgi:hypothetical protein